MDEVSSCHKLSILMKYEKEVVESLESTDLTKLCEEAVEMLVVPQHVKQNLDSMDENVPRPLVIRYLLMHMYRSIQENPKLYFRLLDLLHKHLSSANVLDMIQFEMLKTSPPSPLSTYAMSLAEGISDVLVSSQHQSNPQDAILERHIPLLTELLVGCAHKWENISIALGLPERVRKDLRAKQDSDCVFYFSQVLTRWVLDRYEHARPPTLGNLAAVLKTQQVGLAMEAEKLNNIDVDAFSIEEKWTSLPKKPRLDPLPLPVEIVQQSRDTTVSEGKSTLLEVQAVTSRDVNVSYKWLKDEHDLSGDSHGNILCISCASISSKGAYKCEVSISGDSPTISASSAPINLTVSLSAITSTLVTRYLSEPEVPEDSWPPAGSNTYIHLALIKQGRIDKAGEYGRNTVQGSVDDILTDKESIEYENTFTNFKSATRLLIEGRPGSGKTTLVHKFSRDWARGNPQLNVRNLKLLFLVHLRGFFNDHSISLQDIVQLYYKQPNVDTIVKQAEESCGEGFCFILDGLDDYHPKSFKKTFIYKLITRQKLLAAVVIITSRPAASHRFRTTASKEIEVIGFTREQIFEYIEVYPFSNPDRKGDLCRYLEHHPNVHHMCYLPIHAAMMCYLFNIMGNTLPRTETEMYTAFTHLTLFRTIKRNEESQLEQLKSVSDLTEQEQDIFSRICKLSYEKTLSSKQVMKRSEVKDFFSDINCGGESMGLITVDRMSRLCGFDNFYTFLHLTFQEYLAAYYLFKYSRDKLKELQKHSKKKHMQVVWKFYCGLESFFEKDAKLGTLFESADGILSCVQCAFESQQSVVCDYVVESGEHGTLSFKGHFLTLSDLTAIGYVMKTSSCPVEKFVLDDCKLGHEGVDAFFEEAGESVSSVKTLCFRRLQRGSSYILQRLSSIEVLELSDSKSAAREVLTDILPCYRHLQTLKCISCDIADSDVKAFAAIVYHYEHLCNLSFKSNRIGDEGAMALAVKLQQCSSLRVLDLKSNRISKDGAKALIASLQHCKNLEAVCLDSNSMADNDVETFKENLEYLKVYRQVLDKNESIKMWFVKMVLIGAPGLGKTTVRRRLMGEIKDITSSGEGIQPSTGVVESGRTVLIRKLFSTLAVVTHSEWRATKDLTDETSMILQLLHDYFHGKHLYREEESTPDSEGMDHEVMEAAPKVDIVSASSNATIMHTSILASDLVIEPSVVHQGISVLPQSIKTINEQDYNNSEWLDRLRQAIETNSWKDVEDLFMEVIFLWFEDTGGQPEFMDMLPALTIGPALYLLFCKLTDDFQKPYTVTYRSSSDESTAPVQSTYTVEEVILSALASIDCLTSVSSLVERPANADYKELLDCSKKSIAYIIGTHRDKVTEDVVKSFNMKLQDSIEATAFFKQQLVWPLSGDDEMIFPIDNMNGGEEEVERMRCLLEKGIKEHFTRLAIPASWLVLSLHLRSSKKRAVSYEYVLQVAEKELNISEEELKTALWFLHHHAGVLMYFPKLSELADTVICDPQLVYDSTTSLIVNTFERGRVHPVTANKFRETGQFLLSDIEKATKDISENFLPLDKLLLLLKHLNIIVPVDLPPTGQDLSCEYFMPCVLRNASQEELGEWWEKHSKPSPATLFFVCECGYMPIGVFPALIANLYGGIRSGNGIKQFLKGRKKNLVHFRFGQFCDKITLISQPKFYAVHVEQRCSSNPLQSVCNEVRCLIESALKIVTSRMNYSFSFGYQLAFECSMCLESKDKKHLCVLDKSSKVLQCLEESEDHWLDMNEHQNVWFKEVLLKQSILKRHISELTELEEALNLEHEHPPSSKRSRLETLPLEIVRPSCDVVISDQKNILEVQALTSQYVSCGLKSMRSNQPGKLSSTSDLEFMQSLMYSYKLSEDDFSCQISEENLSSISSSCCSKWRKLPHPLGMDQIVAKDVDHNFPEEEEKRQSFLFTWKERKGYEATYKSLVRALIAINCREDAEKVCKFLQSFQSQTPKGHLNADKYSTTPNQTGRVSLSNSLEFMQRLMDSYKLSEEVFSRQISEEDLSSISSSFCSKWRKLPHRLGMDQIVVNDVERDCPKEEERRHSFLFTWKEKRGSEATYGSLISALIIIKCREDAESVCKLLQSSQSQPSTVSESDDWFPDGGR